MRKMHQKARDWLKTLKTIYVRDFRNYVKSFMKKVMLRALWRG